MDDSLLGTLSATKEIESNFLKLHVKAVTLAK